MLKVGLTGGIASGKTTVSNLFKQKFSIPVLDADEISRALLAVNTPAYNEVIQLFGAKVLKDDQQLDRQFIRKIIFSDPAKRSALEAIIHPRVRAEITNQLQALTADYCLIVIPLLIEADMTDLIDRICVIDVSNELQIQRLETRDRCSHELATEILSTQLDRDSRLAHADDVISNDDDLSHLNHQICKLHEKYLAICHQPTHN